MPPKSPGLPEHFYQIKDLACRAQATSSQLIVSSLLFRPPRTYTSKKIGNKPRSRVAGKAKWDINCNDYDDDDGDGDIDEDDYEDHIYSRCILIYPPQKSTAAHSLLVAKFIFLATFLSNWFGVQTVQKSLSVWWYLLSEGASVWS